MTPMARSFYGENKRVSNERIKTLGYEFTYPDYKTAFSAHVGCGQLALIAVWAHHTA